MESGITESVLFEPENEGEPWGYKCHHSHCDEKTVKDVFRWLAIQQSIDSVPHLRHLELVQKGILLSHPQREQQQQQQQSEDDGVISAEWREWQTRNANRLILSEADMLDFPEPPMLVDDLLIANTLSVLVSKPGVGKSFVALDLALSIAAGLDSFLGLPLRAQGPVLYVIAEGGGRFKRRLKAWKQYRRITRPIPFHWTHGAINLLDVGGVGRLIAEIQRIRPKLVVIDTLSRCLVGVDENSQAEMSAAVEALDRIRTATEDLTVLALHHLNATGSRERGSSVLNGALDTHLRLRRVGDDEGKRKKLPTPVSSTHIRLITHKQKDLDEGRFITLEKTIVLLDGELEPSGKPATSVVWVRGDRPLADRVREYVRAHPDATKNEVVANVEGRRADILQVLKEGSSEGSAQAA